MEDELRHNLDQAQQGLVQEFAEHQETKAKLKKALDEVAFLEEQLYQAQVVIKALNDQLALARHTY